jgi:hypothetical protein
MTVEPLAPDDAPSSTRVGRFVGLVKRDTLAGSRLSTGAPRTADAFARLIVLYVARTLCTSVGLCEVTVASRLRLAAVTLSAMLALGTLKRKESLGSIAASTVASVPLPPPKSPTEAARTIAILIWNS